MIRPDPICAESLLPRQEVCNYANLMNFTSPLTSEEGSGVPPTHWRTSGSVGYHIPPSSVSLCLCACVCEHLFGAIARTYGHDAAMKTIPEVPTAVNLLFLMLCYRYEVVAVVVVVWCRICRLMTTTRARYLSQFVSWKQAPGPVILWLWLWYLCVC